jgi:hypothetical protein
MKKTKRYDGEDGSMVEAGSGPMTEPDNSGAAPVAAPSAPKQRIVTKEELAKSGLSLRDFLNKERGLTRRGESAPAAAPAKSAAMTKDDQYNPDVRVKKPEMYRTFGGKMAAKAPESQPSTAASEMVGRGMKAAGEYAKSLGNREEKHGTYVKDGKVVKYAKGGSVSKASSRADGIAQRGKTKGRMI